MFHTKNLAILRTLFSILSLVAVLCAASLTSRAQDEEVVRTDVSLVQLNVGVVDRTGRAITTLSQNDFAVYEDGVKQNISHFEPSYAPFSLVLLMDMSGSTLTFRQQLQQAALRFVDALQPDDRIAVVSFCVPVKKRREQIELLSPFTSDRAKIAFAISRASGDGETNFYKALGYALKQLDKEGRRRKAVIVLTDGLDTQMRNIDRAMIAKAETDAEALAAIKPETSTLLNSVLNTADREGVTIYPLALPSGDPKRLPLPGPDITGIYAAARMRLQILADRTGGRLNEIRRLDEMARLYAEVAAELRTLYTVAYQSKGQRARDGKWHEIKIELTRPELIARTRPGYFAK